MSTIATVAIVGITAFAAVAIVRPDVAHHALNVAEKAIDAISGNKHEKDTEMSYETRRGRSRYN